MSECKKLRQRKRIRETRKSRNSVISHPAEHFFDCIGDKFPVGRQLNDMFNPDKLQK